MTINPYEGATGYNPGATGATGTRHTGATGAYTSCPGPWEPVRQVADPWTPVLAWFIVALTVALITVCFWLDDRISTLEHPKPQRVEMVCRPIQDAPVGDRLCVLP